MAILRCETSHQASPTAFHAQTHTHTTSSHIRTRTNTRRETHTAQWHAHAANPCVRVRARVRERENERDRQRDTWHAHASIPCQIRAMIRTWSSFTLVRLPRHMNEGSKCDGGERQQSQYQSQHRQRTPSASGKHQLHFWKKAERYNAEILKNLANAATAPKKDCAEGSAAEARRGRGRVIYVGLKLIDHAGRSKVDRGEHAAVDQAGERRDRTAVQLLARLFHLRVVALGLWQLVGGDFVNVRLCFLKPGLRFAVTECASSSSYTEEQACNRHTQRAFSLPLPLRYLSFTPFLLAVFLLISLARRIN